MRHQDFRNSRRRDSDADIDQPQPRVFGTRPRFSQARFEAPSGPPVQGAVRWFSPEKGFGFVELFDGSGDAFLHGAVLAQNRFGMVQPGDILEVRIGPGHKGPHVTEVLSVDSSTAPPVAPRRSSHRSRQRGAETAQWEPKVWLQQPDRSQPGFASRPISPLSCSSYCAPFSASCRRGS